jgi:diacylglycerol kinase
MFERYSYLGYTLLFCAPAIVLLWLRADFARVMKRDLRGILTATGIITLYGSLIWPIAIRWGCWSYAETRILNRKLFGWVHVEDVVWWLLVSFLFASFVSLSTRRGEAGEDLVVREVAGLARSFRNAFAGFRAFSLERNMTIHAAAAVAALLAAWLFRVTRLEWLLVALCVAGVVAAELLNCAVERLAPGRDRGFSAEIRLAKDAAASGVLAASAGAAIVGLAVFLPRVLAALR